jgi:predicted TIM-barrel fold metal-dependent hydrolase
MNYHDPLAALDLAEEHANVRVDTSWQPTEIIGEAVRRLGAEKVLFGTDWPLMGQNIAVGLARVRDCVATGMFTQADADLVLGGNAARLLRLGDASPA